jgi:transposase
MQSKHEGHAGHAAKGAKLESLKLIQPNAAGIDVGATSHWIAVPADRDAESVRTFGTYTRDLHAIAEWLIGCGITTVAMESTGVFWVPLYEILRARGLEVCLVNATHVKNVPGRKTDVLDCQWIQKLHSFGLLRSSFRPESDFVTLRSYLRHRDSLTEMASAHIQHMQKALTLMNVQVHHAVTDITGATGMRIIRDIVAGNHDPDALAEHRDHRCKKTKAEIAAALRGEYREELLFALRQALELFDAYQIKIVECDHQIALLLETMDKKLAPTELPPLGPQKKKKRGAERAFRVPIREPLYRITAGVDLANTVGLADLTALKIIAEIGTDMSKWPTEKHFVSWTTLAPGSRITGGKAYSARRPETAHRVAQILRLCAMSASQSATAIGAFFRRLAVRTGKAKAIVATAAKLARLIYNMLKHGKSYADPGPDAYNHQYRDRVLRSLKRRALELGLRLVPDQTSEPTSSTVS